jgi:hypothetical protein
MKFYTQNIYTSSPQLLYTFNSNQTYACVKGICRSSTNLVMVQWIFAMQSYAPLTLKNRNVLVSLIVSPKVVLIELKFNVWISCRNTQVKFEFGHGLIDFWQSYPSWTLKEIIIFYIFFCSLSTQHVYTFTSNLTFRYIKFEFGPGSIIFNEVYSLLNVEKKNLVSHAILILRKCLFKVEITCAGIYPENTSHVSIWFWLNDFWQSYPSLNLEKIRNFQFLF